MEIEVALAGTFILIVIRWRSFKDEMDINALGYINYWWFPWQPVLISSSVTWQSADWASPLPAVTLDWCPYIPQYMYMYIYCFLGLRICCWHSNILCVNSCVTVCNSINSGVLSKVGRDLVFINHQYTVTNCYSWLPEEREGPSHGKDKFLMIYSNQFCFYLFRAWIIFTLHYFLWPRILCFETIKLT